MMKLKIPLRSPSKKIEDYLVKVNQHAYNLMTEFHQGVESRLKALTLNNGQRIHNKVWDDLVIQELKNTMSTFTEFYAEYISEEFEEKHYRYNYEKT